MQFDTLLDA